jgi:hypothetical protein
VEDNLRYTPNNFFIVFAVSSFRFVFFAYLFVKAFCRLRTEVNKGQNFDGKAKTAAAYGFKTLYF